MRLALKAVLYALFLVLAPGAARIAEPAPGQAPVKPGPIVVGINREFPPYEFLGPTGEPEGYDVDLIRAAAAEVELSLVFRADTWAHIKADLEAGRIDVVPGMLYSEERAGLVEFSAPHLLVHYCIFTRNGTRGVTSLADLTGKKVLVEAASRMHEYLLAHGFGREIHAIASEPEALRLLSSKSEYEAAILPRIEGLEMIHDLHISNVRPLQGSVLSEELCFAVARNRGRLRAKLDSGVAILNRSGKYREIYDKWFVPLEPGAGNSIRVLRILGWTTLGALVLGALALVWSWSLRRQVHRKTESLRVSEAATLASQMRFQAIFNSTNDAIFIHDLGSGEILDVNQRALEMYQYTREELLALPLEGLGTGIPPYTGKDALEWIRKAGQGTPQVFEWQTQGKAGLPFWVEVNMRRTTMDGQGRLVVAVRDIAERKQAELEKGYLQAQLQQAQKMESLGILAGGVAHDMNNVLGAILATASANQEDHPPGSRAFLAFEKISLAAARGGRMVNNLLGFARQRPTERSVLNVNDLLREQMNLLEHTTLSSIELRQDFAPDLRPISGDASALTNAFINLCVNGVDAMEGHGTLLLRTRNAPGDQVEVTVEDTGSGMPRDVLEKALDPFFTTKAVGKGTGLGLSMVFSTVKAHGGQMEIRTVEGSGTTVTLRLPACSADGPTGGVEPRPPKDPAQRRLSVLLVDDDDLVRASIQEVLADLGHATTEAASGEEALHRLDEGHRPDLVILDVNMPGLGGVGTLPRLRSLCPTLPVLVATGRVDQRALDLVQAYPGVMLLAKPFSKADLCTVLEKVLPPPA